MRSDKSKEKQAELNRYKDILLATIDYIIQKVESERLPKNDFDGIAGYYQQQKAKAEKCFLTGRLDLLQKQLTNLTMFPMRKADLAFNDYIKQKTGYEIDIFESLRIRIEAIISQKQIKNKEQISDIFIMLEVCKQGSDDQDKSDVLKNLLSNYANKIESLKTSK